MITLIKRLEESMTAARDSADGQTKPGQIILSREAYEALYYAALDAKKVLVVLKGVL